MRPPSPIEPFIPSDAITLHPTLQAVLDNLDVQIDAELSRYRRQRRNSNATPRRRPITASAPTAIGILKQSIQLPQPRASIYDSPANAPAKSIERSQQPALAAEPVARQATQSPPIQTWVAPAPAIPKPVAPPVPVPVPAVATPTPNPAAITSYAQQYDLSAYAPDSVLQRLMQQLEPVAPVAPAPAIDEGDDYRDYLASSEELLRSMAEEESMRQPEQPNSPLDTLLTPLGIGSMLLLLLSSTTLGYVVMNPSSIGLKTAEDAPSVAKTAERVDGANSAASENLPSPNLAAEEFRDLGLDTLSSIPKSGSARSTAKSSSASQPTSQSKQANSPSGRKSAPVYTESKTRLNELPIVTAPELPPAPAIEPSFSTVVIPAQPPAAPVAPVQPARSAPRPAPAISPEPISIAPPPVVPIQPSVQPSVQPSQGHYYVVTEYSGDPSLREAREAVPDAYVRNIPSEGAKVQLGAFSDETKAQELQQELRQQGIEAEVYRP